MRIKKIGDPKGNPLFVKEFKIHHIFHKTHVNNIFTQKTDTEPYLNSMIRGLDVMVGAKIPRPGIFST